MDPVLLAVDQERLLRETFYSAINYWCPRHGWEENAFEQWKLDRVKNDADFIGD